MKNFIKKTGLLQVLFCFSLLAHGQVDNMPFQEKPTGYDIPDHIKSRKAYQRMEWFSLQRRFPYDTFPACTYANERACEIQKIKATRSERTANSSWSSVGPKGIQTPYQNWGVISGRVRAVAVHPTDPLTVYIGAACGGIWKTADGGATWNDIGHDLESLSFGAIAIDPENPEIIYAGSGECNLLEHFVFYPGCGLFKSTDGGQNWSLITNGFGTLTFFSDLAVSPYNSNILIASLGGLNVYTGSSLANEGVWKSTDGGITWNMALDIPGVFDIAFHPSDPDTVYAAAGGYYAPLSGFYISDDQGNTWTQSNNGLIIPENGGRIQFDISRSDPDIVYAVIYAITDNAYFGSTKAFKSIDAGKNWFPISAGSNLGGYFINQGMVDQGWYDLCIAVDPIDPDHVLIGNVELHRTINGSVFSPVRPFGNDGGGSLVHVDYHKLVFAPSDPDYLYIGCDGGIYQSTNRGYSAYSRNAGLETLQFYRITAHPDNPEIIVGGMQDNGTARTPNGGASWFGISHSDGMECFFDKTDPDILYSSIQNGTLYKSYNGGNTFGLLGNLDGAWTTPIFIHPANHDILYAATKHIKKSINGGGIFEIIAPNVSPANISTMAQSQVNTNNMIFGTGIDNPHFAVLFKVKISTDEGLTWTDVTSNIPGEHRWISRVATDPADENTMYVLRTGFSPGNKVWKTNDLGQTWINISGDLPDLPVNDLFIDPDHPGHIYLANDIGIYLTTDGGEHWNYASENIPYVPCIDFHYEKIDNLPYLWIGTHGRSIYRTRLDDGEGVESAVGGRQSAVSVYPNPTRRIVDFRFSVVDFRWISLKVYNAQGQEVTTVLEGSWSGDQVVRWDAGALPAGIYYYRLTTDDRRLTTGKIMKY